MKGGAQGGTYDIVLVVKLFDEELNKRTLKNEWPVREQLHCFVPIFICRFYCIKILKKGRTVVGRAVTKCQPVRTSSDCFCCCRSYCNNYGVYI